jgi:hypothetical protein
MKMWLKVFNQTLTLTEDARLSYFAAESVDPHMPGAVVQDGNVELLFSPAGFVRVLIWDTNQRGYREGNKEYFIDYCNNELLRRATVEKRYGEFGTKQEKVRVEEWPLL